MASHGKRKESFKEFLESSGCDLPETAERYARLQRLENYFITEHQFVNP